MGRTGINFRKRSLFASLACFVAAGAIAVPPSFEHFDQRDGLSNNSVMGILQDTQGFMWFATENGLNRFDGYEFRQYHGDRRDPGALPGDWIWEIAQDAAGDLWLATEGGGLVRWEHQRDRFTAYRSGPDGLPSDLVRAVMTDPRGVVWAGTRQDGLVRLDPGSGAITHYRHEFDDPASLGNDMIYALHAGRDGEIWVGTDAGLDLLDSDTGAFTHFRHDPNDTSTLSNGRVIDIEQDHTGALWIGTFGGGVNRLDPETGEFERYRHDRNDTASLSANIVRVVFEDSQRRLWVGTEDGLNVFDRDTETFERFYHDDADPASLADSDVMSIYEDRGGNLWFGTRAGGVSKWNPRAAMFGFFRGNWLESSEVTSFATEDDGVWIGTMGAGLKWFDLQTGEVRHYRHDPSTPGGITDDLVMSLLRDRDGYLWIGTMTGGLNRMDPAREHVTVFRHDPNDATTLGADGIMSMMQDQQGKIWIGTFGGGVSRYDPDRGRFERFVHDPNRPGSLTGSRATSIVQHPNGDIWIGTDGDGLNRFNADDGTFTNFRFDRNDSGSLSGNAVFSMHIDAAGRLWVGTAGQGLDRVESPAAAPADVRFENVPLVREHSGDSIFGIHSDRAGRLWLSTNQGLAIYEPEAGTLRALHHEDGIQGDDFNFGAHHRAADGRLFFGGTQGFNAFDPMSIEPDERSIPVVLTGFEIANRSVARDRPYELLDAIELDYRDKVATFEFAGLDFAHPRRIRYAYKLDNFDSDWSEIGNRHRVTYTNLDAGNYVLRVKAANGDASFSTVGLTLPIRVRPGPWATAWAYGIYAAIALLLGAFGWYLHQRRLERGANYRDELEREVSARTREIEIKNVRLEELSRAKSDFLARMSHEIRTPLNGVLGMAELLTATANHEDRRSFASTMRSSAESLIDIINDVLDVSKIEAGKLEIAQVVFDLGELIDGTLAILDAAARDKGLDLSFDASTDTRRLVVGDPLRLRQVLVNLVGNAIKFTDEGEVLVRCVEQPAGGDAIGFRFEVSDTGIGISADKQEQIFDAFTQEDDTTMRRYGGTGLGLAISRQLVELMGGEIGVHSALGEGATFWFTLLCAPAPAGFPAVDAAELDATRYRMGEQTVNGELSGLTGRVLLVEDTRVNQAVVAAMLRRLGCTADVVADGAAAIDKVRAATFDLILMDSHMPILDGMRATQAIRAQEADGTRVPIVALTADVRADHLERCLAAGMNACLTKPFTLKELHTVLAHWMKKNGNGVAPAPEVSVPEWPATSTVINLERLRAVFPPGEEDGIREVVTAFLEDSAELVDAIDAALDRGEAELVRTSGHALKSNSGEVGAEALVNICRALEQAAAGGDLDEARAQYKALQRLYPDVVAALEAELRKGSNTRT
ncbi:MAG: two-component regulator propeller domain-containing protein [Gammaproteobacteria bacterium]